MFVGTCSIIGELRNMYINSTGLSRDGPITFQLVWVSLFRLPENLETPLCCQAFPGAGDSKNPNHITAAVAWLTHTTRAIPPAHSWLLAPWREGRDGGWSGALVDGEEHGRRHARARNECTLRKWEAGRFLEERVRLVGLSDGRHLSRASFLSARCHGGKGRGERGWGVRPWRYEGGGMTFCRGVTLLGIPLAQHEVPRILLHTFAIPEISPGVVSCAALALPCPP